MTTETKLKRIRYSLKHKGSVTTNVNWLWGSLCLIGMLFFMFHVQGGWFRVDCALKIEVACTVIQQEYAKAASPKH